ncbi:alpha-L-fucosidase [Ruminococcus sp.]|uniref:alpha-L-fucosidase n=1 Tax=Ruminococcus sp. TaxID=41978 RepID=UPI0025E17356|nr:alpha-L-fucosidase [Ruminococcus sp.]MBQ8966278.1 alpha-L-fucosidase [Ruminococcus sp.]
MDMDERLVSIVPSERQLRHQCLEFYAFIHFTVNTFTDREWGDGSEETAVFDPKSFDAEQWAKAVKSAGMRGLILTCKHHDGFCLWDTATTRHSAMYSPFGRDAVREVSTACKKHGLAFGVYLSPWDRHCPLYGNGREYDDFFIAQLTELLTGYGEIFSVWFDGACGEGANGRKQYYDWERYYAVIRKLQPNACISVCGPDVRWCGNEAGHTRPAEWSVVPARTRDTEKIAEQSQQEDSSEFRQRKISAWDEDLGSRKALENEEELVWYPAEVNTSIRPGWFWHESEDDRVRSLEELADIYMRSVGRNAAFLLNVPPTREGLIHENDVKRLGELGQFLREAFGDNILAYAKLSADSEAEGHSVEGLVTEDYESFYMAKNSRAEIAIDLGKDEPIGYVVLKENIKLSQRVESFCVDIWDKGQFKQVYEGTVIGYKRIVPMNGISTAKLRIRITDSRMAPTLAFAGVYRA